MLCGIPILFRRETKMHKFKFSSFEEFLAEVGKKPGSGYSIDRINNDGHYEPGNVRWATRSQ